LTFLLLYKQMMRVVLIKYIKNLEVEMRILLFEDDAASIQSAKNQFADHDLDVIETCEGLMRFVDRLHYGSETFEEKYGLILTDLNVKLGKDQFAGSYKDFSGPDDTFPAGLALILAARHRGIPCLLATDSNGHRDAMGAILDTMSSAWLPDGPDETSNLIKVRTRPDWINDCREEGKDWKSMMDQWAFSPK